jgi:hypothetical protein
MNPAEHPILFNGEMVNAILDGRKTQTRRPLKPQPPEDFEDPCQGRDGHWFVFDNRPPDILDSYPLRSPFGQPGDTLWVRETWADVNSAAGPGFLYRADGAAHMCTDDAYPVEYERYPGCGFAMWWSDLMRGEPDHSWRPSIHMPRWASRITLTVKRVWVERVQDISAEDALAEGVRPGGTTDGGVCIQLGFVDAWDGIYAKPGLGWDVNPWVWACEFEVSE